jgi:hypothetical protein
LDPYSRQIPLPDPTPSHLLCQTRTAA